MLHRGTTSGYLYAPLRHSFQVEIPLAIGEVNTTGHDEVRKLHHNTPRFWHFDPQTYGISSCEARPLDLTQKTNEPPTTVATAPKTGPSQTHIEVPLVTFTSDGVDGSPEPPTAADDDGATEPPRADDDDGATEPPPADDDGATEPSTAGDGDDATEPPSYKHEQSVGTTAGVQAVHSGQDMNK